jgi:hypothetical protein
MSSPYLERAERRLAVLERIIPRTDGQDREMVERSPLFTLEPGLVPVGLNDLCSSHPCLLPWGYGVCLDRSPSGGLINV